MQIESLKVFSDLVDTASFSLAAQKNNVTQSAVSQQIRALENRYNVTFFERGKKNFSVTPEGQVFDAAAREMMDIFAGIGESISALNNVVSGKLRVATIHSIGLHQLPALVASFREDFPEVELEVSYHSADDVYAEVEEGRADVGVVGFPKARRGVVVEEVTSEKLVIIATPDSEIATRKRMKLSDVGDNKFIGFTQDSPTRKGIDKLFREAGASVDTALAFDDVETVKRAVIVEGGIAIVPESSVSHEVKTGILVSIDITGVNAIRPIGVVKKRTRATSPALREFLEVLPQVA